MYLFLLLKGLFPQCALTSQVTVPLCFQRWRGSLLGGKCRGYSLSPGLLRDIYLNVLTRVPFSLKEGVSADPCRDAIGIAVSRAVMVVEESQKRLRIGAETIAVCLTVKQTFHSK